LDVKVGKLGKRPFEEENVSGARKKQIMVWQGGLAGGKTIRFAADIPLGRQNGY